MAAIGIIDYGMGNLHSLSKALEKVCGHACVVLSREPEQLARCDRLVLPGVGAAAACMAELRRLGLDEFVREQVQRKPLLGVCLGMQVLLDESTENGGVTTLGLIHGQVLRFPDPPPAGASGGPRLKVPQMGWNRVHQSLRHPLWAGVADASWFYFVHSYYAVPASEADFLGEARYGLRFAAAVAHGNLAGVQFHPEKSQAAGLRVLANFTAWQGADGG